MKKLFLAFLCTASLATQCQLPEKTHSFYTVPASMKEKLHHFDKQAGHALVIGNTLVWSCIGAAAGSTVIPAIGVAVIVAHSALMKSDKKLTEKQKSLKA
jgi:hypothetical protein